MRTFILSLTIIFASSLLAVEKVQFPESFADGWEPYIGKMVQITTPLYVCGNYYDSLILAPERLYVPEERAIGYLTQIIGLLYICMTPMVIT